MTLVRAWIALQVLACVTGCTHIHLRKNASKQLRTTSDIHQQQVMDNIAKIAANPAAWPEFSPIEEGLTQVADDGGSSLGLRWNARTIVEEAFGLSARRVLTESWKTNPTIEAPRLRAMWAVYHYTVYGYIPDVPGYDPDKQFTPIYGANWRQTIPTPGWFSIYCENEHECSEKVYCGCVVGHHCDVRACVHDNARASLQQLTYLIMDLATVQFESGFPTGGPEAEEEVAANGAALDVPRLRRVPVYDYAPSTIAPALSP